MLVTSPPAYVKPVRTLDIETYRNYFLIKLYDRHTKRFFSFEFYAGRPLNWLALSMMLREGTYVTFNGNKYDMLMLSAAATGRFNNSQLKDISDFVIVNCRKRKKGEAGRQMQPWEVAQHFGFEMIQWLDHIDLFEVTPGDGSLKIFAGRLHSRKMQDLPYPVDAILTRQQMIEVERYCGNDLLVTDDLFAYLLEDIGTREQLTEQYGLDMRSKSDAQIAEAAFKKLLNLDYRSADSLVASAQLRPGHVLKYRTPAFLKFSTPEMQDALARVQRANFVISDAGQPLEPPELDGYEIKLGAAVYRMGIGGLHSSEARVAHIANSAVSLVDFDVASYYPKIMSVLGLFPTQIGPVFLTIFNEWIDTRLAYKNKGEKKKAATYKIKLNGTFGKSNSKYSVIFSPDMFLHVVMTGQLSLLMLIDMLHLAGIDTVQTNTDGVVTKCHPSQSEQRAAIVKHWEALTGFTMEATEYAGVFSRDVNNYLAAKPAYTDSKGVFHELEWKAKGAYADPGLAKNPTNIICVDAVKDYLAKGVPIEKTIRQCTDIRKFVTVRAVKGGGYWVKDTINAERVREKRAALERAGWVGENKGKTWYEPCGDNIPRTVDEALKKVRGEIPRDYLGKAVRWYYGAGQHGHIATNQGGLVARSEGAKPCMELPDILPPDINYDWYINEARDLLQQLGI